MFKHVQSLYYGGENSMCSVGDAFNIEIAALNAKFYKCSDCKNEFRGVGNKVVCPSCHSGNVSPMFKDE